MELEELLKQIEGFQASEPNRVIARLKLVAQALVTVREGELKSECRTAAYLTCIEILVHDTIRRIELPSKT